MVPGSTLLGPSSLDLISMWVFPTTLTAGRGLWSVGNISCCKVHTTTSELAFVLDGNNADGNYNTSGLGLVINKWQFLAFMISQVADGAHIIEVWIGDESTPPLRQAATQTVLQADTVLGTNSFTIGNIGTGTVAWQGDIASVVAAHGTGLAASADLSPMAAYGALTSAELDQAEQKLILPIWLGDYECITRAMDVNPAVVPSARWFCDLEGGPAPLFVGRGNSAAIPPFVLATNNGATVSKNGTPRPARTRPGLQAAVRQR